MPILLPFLLATLVDEVDADYLYFYNTVRNWIIVLLVFFSTYSVCYYLASKYRWTAHTASADESRRRTRPGHHRRRRSQPSEAVYARVFEHRIRSSPSPSPSSPSLPALAWYRPAEPVHHRRQSSGDSFMSDPSHSPPLLLSPTPSPSPSLSLSPSPPASPSPPSSPSPSPQHLSLSPSFSTLRHRAAPPSSSSRHLLEVCEAGDAHPPDAPDDNQDAHTDVDPWVEAEAARIEFERGFVPFLIATFVFTVSAMWVLTTWLTITVSIPNLYSHWLLAWLNFELVYFQWQVLVWMTSFTLFVLAPFAYLFYEAEGFGRYRGTCGRVSETLVVLTLSSILLSMSFWVVYLIWSGKDSLYAFRKSAVSNVIHQIPGLALVLLVTNFGFYRILSKSLRSILPLSHRAKLSETAQLIDLELDHLVNLLRDDGHTELVDAYGHDWQVEASKAASRRCCSCCYSRWCCCCCFVITRCRSCCSATFSTLYRLLTCRYRPRRQNHGFRCGLAYLYHRLCCCRKPPHARHKHKALRRLRHHLSSGSLLDEVDQLTLEEVDESIDLVADAQHAIRPQLSSQEVQRSVERVEELVRRRRDVERRLGSSWHSPWIRNPVAGVVFTLATLLTWHVFMRALFHQLSVGVEATLTFLSSSFESLTGLVLSTRVAQTGPLPSPVPHQPDMCSVLGEQEDWTTWMVFTLVDFTTEIILGMGFGATDSAAAKFVVDTAVLLFFLAAALVVLTEHTAGSARRRARFKLPFSLPRLRRGHTSSQELVLCATCLLCLTSALPVALWMLGLASYDLQRFYEPATNLSEAYLVVLFNAVFLGVGAWYASSIGSQATQAQALAFLAWLRESQSPLVRYPRLAVVTAVSAVRHVVCPPRSGAADAELESSNVRWRHRLAAVRAAQVANARRQLRSAAAQDPVRTATPSPAPGQSHSSAASLT